MNIRATTAIRSTERLAAVLPGKLKSRTLVVVALLLVNSLLELLGLASLIPVFVALMEPNVADAAWLRPFYNVLAPIDETTFIVVLAVAALAIFTAKTVVVLAIIRALGRFSLSVYDHFSTAAHRDVFLRGLESVQERSSHKMTRDINTAPLMFAQHLVLPLLMFWNELVLLILALIAVIAIQPLGALLLMAVLGPACAIFYGVFRRRNAKIGEDLHEYNAKLNRDLYESIHGYKDVILCGREGYFVDAYARDVQAVSGLMVESHLLGAAPSRTNELAAVVGVTALVVYGVHAFADRADLRPILGVFGIAAYRLLPSVNRILGSLLSVRRHEYLFEVIESIRESDPEFDHEEEPPLAMSRELRINDITFRFREGQENVLNGITLAVQRGECVGIVGSSGSGKTTLLNIMLRFLRESEGSMYVDDVQLTPQLTRSWRRMIGFVPQDVFLVEGTLAANIAFGQVEVDSSRLNRALRLACLEDVVRGLPQGVETEIGERGARLSGGQRQRIAIARALYSGAEVLVFDEATSALDSQTEREITDSIQELVVGGLTLIVVAHRISTLRHCQKVVRMREGRIVESTTYDELVEQEAIADSLGASEQID